MVEYNLRKQFFAKMDEKMTKAKQAEQTTKKQPDESVSKKKNGKAIITTACVFVGTILVFLGLLTLTNLIPKQLLFKNISVSAGQVAEYQVADQTTPQMYSQYKMDYYTDSVMLNAAYFTDTEHPIKSAIRCSLYGGGIEQLQIVASSPNIGANYSYGRYWHGYLAVLRPLLIFFDYIEIGIFNTYLFYLLLLLNLIIVYKRIGSWFSAVFLFTIISLNITVLPLNMQLFTVFAITFAAVPLVVWLFEKKREWLKYAFMVIGMCTMYFDFYTYPMMTFGLPMIVLLLLADKSAVHDENPIKRVLLCLAFWALGYALTWLVKIGLIYFALGSGEVQTLSASFSARISRTIPDSIYAKLTEGLASLTSGLSVDKIPLWCISLGLVAMHVLNPVFLVGLGVVVITAIGFHVFCKARSGRKGTVAALLLVAGLPILWYVVAVNPTIIHSYFQYRAIGVSLLAMLSVLFVGIDMGNLKHRRKA